MKLSIKLLRSLIGAQDVWRSYEASTPFQFDKIRLGVEGDMEDSGCLYYLGSSFFSQLLSQIPPRMPSVFAASCTQEKADDCCDLIRGIYPESQFLLLNADVGDGEWFNRILQLQDRQHHLELKLQQALLREAPYEELLDICEDIVGNPIALFDRDLKLMGNSSTMSQSIQKSRYWAAVESSHFASEELIKRLQEMKLLDQVANTKHPLLIDLENGDPPYLTGNLYNASKEKVASISVFAAEKPVCEEDAVLLEQLIDILSERVSGDVHTADQEEHTRAKTIIANVIRGINYPEKTVRRAFASLNFNWEEGMRVLVLPLITDRWDPHMIQYYKNMLKKQLTGSINVTIDDYLCFIYKRPLEGDPDYFRNLRRYLRKQRFQCGLSFVFTDWRFLPSQYRFARMAVEQGSKRNVGEVLLEGKDYLLYGLFQSCEQQYDLTEFCMPQVLALYREDPEDKSEQIISLSTYLLYRRSIQRAADALHIHKTTLGYRLKKLEARLGLDLDDPHTAMLTLISCQILQYLMSTPQELSSEELPFE